MYAWKCWRESRARFIFLLILFTVTTVLFTLQPGLGERNGWWYFDRIEYLRNPGPTGDLVFSMILSVMWCSGFLSAVFLGATASGSEIEPGTIEYLWTRPRTRTSVTWTHWGVCVAEMILVTATPLYLAAALLGALTRHWNSSGPTISALLIAPWMMLIVGLPVLGLTTLMTALRRSASGGLIHTSGVIIVYVLLRQIIIVPLHLNPPTLFTGPLFWLMSNNTLLPHQPIAFPWGALCRAVILAAAFPLAAQYLLKRAEV
jgi:ABC-type transport system involved in multi-copper enzyme maturation permease subunit